MRASSASRIPRSRPARATAAAIKGANLPAPVFRNDPEEEKPRGPDPPHGQEQSKPAEREEPPRRPRERLVHIGKHEPEPDRPPVDLGEVGLLSADRREVPDEEDQSEERRQHERFKCEARPRRSRADSMRTMGFGLRRRAPPVIRTRFLFVDSAMCRLHVASTGNSGRRLRHRRRSSRGTLSRPRRHCPSRTLHASCIRVEDVTSGLDQAGSSRGTLQRSPGSRGLALVTSSPLDESRFGAGKPARRCRAACRAPLRQSAGSSIRILSHSTSLASE